MQGFVLYQKRKSMWKLCDVNYLQNYIRRLASVIPLQSESFMTLNRLDKVCREFARIFPITGEVCTATINNGAVDAHARLKIDWAKCRASNSTTSHFPPTKSYLLWHAHFHNRLISLLQVGVYVAVWSFRRTIWTSSAGALVCLGRPSSPIR